MSRKRTKSALPLLPKPSAMLAGTLTAALRACDTNPNLSSGGKSLVTRYTISARSMPFCQAMRSLQSLISDKFHHPFPHQENSAL